MLKPDVANGAIFDGFPRNISQAKALDDALKKQNKAIDKVVYIEVAENELIRRLSERWVCRDCQQPYAADEVRNMAEKQCYRCDGQLYQRPDDRPETVKKRLKVYFTKTAPLTDYYRQEGKLLEVDGQGSVAKIADDILAALEDENS
jgi:adenylate kinase